MSVITPKNDLTAAQVRAALEYDHLSGVFRWRPKKNRTDLSGRVAGAKKRDGYVMFQIGKRHYSAHRIAWLHHFGVWPDGDIDHINGDRADNRIANLRDVTRTINAQNQRRAQRSNATGLLGAHVSPHGDGYVSTIKVNGEAIRLGKFTTPEQAHKAYIEAKRKWHPGNTI